MSKLKKQREAIIEKVRANLGSRLLIQKSNNESDNALLVFDTGLSGRLLITNTLDLNSTYNFFIIPGYKGPTVVKGNEGTFMQVFSESQIDMFCIAVLNRKIDTMQDSCLNKKNYLHELHRRLQHSRRDLRILVNPFFKYGIKKI